VLYHFFLAEWLDSEFPSAPPIAVGEGQREEFGHEDYYPRLRDRPRRRRDDRFGALGSILIRERATELRLRDYIPTIQTIAVGFVLIGLAQALRLSLLIWNWVVAIYQSIQIGPTQ
jgi:hypothetical protein